jgi:hypothetical protein
MRTTRTIRAIMTAMAVRGQKLLGNTRFVDIMDDTVNGTV